MKLQNIALKPIEYAGLIVLTKHYNEFLNYKYFSKTKRVCRPPELC
jgi:hypothetical protein